MLSDIEIANAARPDKISNVAGACGSTLNLRGAVYGALQNGSFDRYRFDLT